MPAARPVTIMATVVVATLALTGCSLIEELGSNVRNTVENFLPDTGGSTATQDTDYVLGDCLDAAATDNMRPGDPVPRVDCALSHDLEVYAVVAVPDIGYPSADKFTAIAEQECYERFEPFTGADLKYSSLDYYYLIPTYKAWSDRDTDFECLVATYDGSPLVGTAHNIDKGLNPSGLHETTAPGAPPPTSALFSELGIGDCFDGGAGEALDVDTRIIVQSCNQAHYSEVYATPPLGFEAYPGDDTVEQRVNDLCFDAFADYVGVDYEASYLAVGYSWPGEGLWNGPDTTAVCILMRYAIGPLLVGSAKGLGI